MPVPTNPTNLTDNSAVVSIGAHGDNPPLTIGGTEVGDIPSGDLDKFATPEAMAQAEVPVLEAINISGYLVNQYREGDIPTIEQVEKVLIDYGEVLSALTRMKGMLPFVDAYDLPDVKDRIKKKQKEMEGLEGTKDFLTREKSKELAFTDAYEKSVEKATKVMLDNPVVAARMVQAFSAFCAGALNLDPNELREMNENKNFDIVKNVFPNLSVNLGAKEVLKYVNKADVNFREFQPKQPNAKTRRRSKAKFKANASLSDVIPMPNVDLGVYIEQGLLYPGYEGDPSVRDLLAFGTDVKSILLQVLNDDSVRRDMDMPREKFATVMYATDSVLAEKYAVITALMDIMNLYGAKVSGREREARAVEQTVRIVSQAENTEEDGEKPSNEAQLGKIAIETLNRNNGNLHERIGAARRKNPNTTPSKGLFKGGAKKPDLKTRRS